MDQGEGEVAALQELFKKKDVIQDEKTFIPIGIGRHIFVVPDIFKGQVRINIREYFVKEADKLKKEGKEESEGESKAVPPPQPRYTPTRRGVSLTVTEFEQLCGKIGRIQKFVKRLGKRLRKQH